MKTIVILTCGHEKDYTNRTDQLPAVGDFHPCWSSCDQVPTWRGRNPHHRFVKAIETRNED